MCDPRLSFVVAASHEFRDDFHEWIQQNEHVFEEFRSRADRLWERGVTRIGARLIWEAMRYDSMIREVSSQFKLNNCFAPDCARLYVALHPDREHLFEFRFGGSKRHREAGRPVVPASVIPPIPASSVIQGYELAA